ncbi:uncharacterized protein LOC128201401 [Galleria mellonella]|uniref:Uncharacterized protein LOC128201401 n=1 Tax=Galleria mellonella TaxID=7137 RepID=A0ABM3MS40_GALME|nr:uncharacterized protein LOC128201401 [Galleria mellonella]
MYGWLKKHKTYHRLRFSTTIEDYAQLCTQARRPKDSMVRRLIAKVCESPRLVERNSLNGKQSMYRPSSLHVQQPTQARVKSNESVVFMYSIENYVSMHVGTQ